MFLKIDPLLCSMPVLTERPEDLIAQQKIRLEAMRSLTIMFQPITDNRVLTERLVDVQRTLPSLLWQNLSPEESSKYLPNSLQERINNADYPRGTKSIMKDALGFYLGKLLFSPHYSGHC